MNAILKMRRKNRRRLYMLLGVLMFFYYEAIATKFNGMTKVAKMVFQVIVRQVRVFKPKSKRMQYLVLLGAAFLVKYLTRFDVFPDDLDY